MFQSLNLKKNENTDTNTDTNIAMDIFEEASFVHVPNENEPSLSLKIQSLHDTIGVNAEKKETEFCATVTAIAIPDDDSKRAPVDIVVALDISGSMRGSKLDLCKTTLNLLLRELRPTDRFGLVAFGSQANVVIPSKMLTKEAKDYAIEKIKSLQTQGCTNMSGGIGLAAQELKSIQSPNEVRSVFLLTDGRANEGIRDKEGIVNLTKGCLVSDEHNPIPIHCFGYGGDHDREMLRDISMATPGGTYYFISNDDDVSSAFGDALGGVLSVVAQNTNLTLRVPPEAANIGAQIVSVQHDDAVKNADGSYSVALKDFYAEESRDVIFQVTLSDVCSCDPVPQMTASIQYLDTLRSKLEQSEEVIGSIQRPEGDEISEMNQHVFLQCIRIQTTDIIAECQKQADQGQIEEAKKKICTHTELLQKHNSTQENTLLNQLLSELDEIKTGLQSRATYEARGSYAMQGHWFAHKHQRCAQASEETPSYYRSSKKMTLAKKMKMMSKGSK